MVSGVSPKWNSRLIQSETHTGTNMKFPVWIGSDSLDYRIDLWLFLVKTQLRGDGVSLL